MESIDKRYYSSDYYASVNNYGVKCGTSLRFWEILGLMRLIIMGGFNSILDIIYEEELKMMRGKLKDGKGLLVDIKTN